MMERLVQTRSAFYPPKGNKNFALSQKQVQKRQALSVLGDRSFHTNTRSPERCYFGGNAKRLFLAPFEKMVQSGEFALRKVGNYYVERKIGPLLTQIDDKLQTLSESDASYLPTILEVGRLFAKTQPMQIEMNEESGRIRDIVTSDEACIFIMNHDYQRQDPVLLSLFCTRLYQEYLKAGKSVSCPRPRILMNEDILLSQGEKLRRIYQKLGAVGLDARLIGTRKSSQKNAKVLRPLLEGFSNNQNHLFLFPEGRMSVYRSLDLGQKFQMGTADLIRLSAKHKGRVKVVPLGFAYNPKGQPTGQKNEKKTLGSIYIGEPIYFTQQKNALWVNSANLTPESAPPAYQSFFWGKPQAVVEPGKPSLWSRMKGALTKYLGFKSQSPESSSPPISPLTKPLPVAAFQEILGVSSKAITEQGKPVDSQNLSPYILDLLIENLRICREQARQQLPKTVLTQGVTTF